VSSICSQIKPYEASTKQYTFVEKQLYAVVVFCYFSNNSGCSNATFGDIILTKLMSDTATSS